MKILIVKYLFCNLQKMTKKELYINFLKSKCDFGNENKTKWVIYVRKSSLWDKKQPNSIETQIKAIKEYVEMNNIELLELTDELKSIFYHSKYLENLSEEVKEFVLKYFVVIEKWSSIKSYRQNLDKLIKMINNDKINNVGYLLVYSLDRIFKFPYSWVERNSILEQLLYKSIKILPVYGWELNLSHEELVNLASIKANYAKEEWRSEVQFLSRIHMLQNRKYNNLGGLYGFILDNWKLYIDERNFHLIKECFNKAKQGMSKVGIINYLEKKWFNYKKIWNNKIDYFGPKNIQSKYAIIRSILENPVYIGEYVDKKFNYVFLFNDIDFPLVIDMETFYQVNGIDVKQILFWEFSDILNDDFTSKCNIYLYDENNKKFKLDFVNGNISKKLKKNIFNDNVNILNNLRFRNVQEKVIFKWHRILKFLNTLINTFTLNLDIKAIKDKIVSYNWLLKHYNKQLTFIRKSIYLLESRLDNWNMLSELQKKLYKNNLSILRKNEEFIQNIIKEYSINIYDIEEIIWFLNYKNFNDAILLQIASAIYHSTEQIVYDKWTNKLHIKYSGFPSNISFID